MVAGPEHRGLAVAGTRGARDGDDSRRRDIAGPVYPGPVPFLTRGRPNVSRMARRGRVDDLRAALRHDEPAVRAEAATALSKFDGSTVAADLTGALGDSDPDVRLAAMRSLETTGLHDPSQVEQLMRSVIERGPAAADVAASAIKLLVASVPEQNAEYLADRLLDPSAPPPDEGHRASLDLFLTTDARGPAAREAVVDMLLARIQHDGDETQARVDALLGWVADDAGEKVLGALENGAVSPTLLRAAGRFGDARAVGPVVRALEDPNAEMREAAAHAAHALNHTRAVPALLNATQDDVQAVRNAATAALDRMGTAAVIAGLAAVVDAQAAQLASGADGPATPEVLRTKVAQALEEAPQAPQDAPSEPEPTSDEPPPSRPTTTSVPSAPSAYPRRRGGIIERIFGRYE